MTNSDVFEPTGLGLQIFNDRYTRYEGETWQDACLRVATHVSEAEKDDDVTSTRKDFYEELISNRFMPGGRIWYGSGRQKAQLLNCFVVPAHDSREGWGDLTKDVIVISGLGGGVGINFSPIRPRGSEIKGTGGKATGSVSLMGLVDGVGEVIVDGAGRRLALMFCLDVTHPDLPEFFNSKLDTNNLNNANISVVINIDTEEFVQKVQNDGEIEFEWNGQKTGETVSAREVWDTIVQNSWENGEPGVLNSDVANKMNNIWYHKELISTNPCGEIWLEEYGCCDLGAIVLPRFVDDEGNVDWVALKKTVHIGTRFLDDVLDVNYYPFDKIRENCQDVRRLGLGVMGLHDFLMDQGVKYSSKEGRHITDQVMKFIKEEAYKASIELAIEKGAFPAYDEKLLESGFAKTLPEDIRGQIKEHGLRNCALLTIAPTGTTSMVAGVTSGIEPLPAVIYERTYFVMDETTMRERNKEIVIDPMYYEDDKGVLESAADLTPEEHFEIQAICQYHVDNAVSKTINLPNDYPQEKLAELWLKYLPLVKGTTFYRWGSREFEPISPIPQSEWHKYVDVAETKETEEIYDDCVGGVCTV